MNLKTYSTPFFIFPINQRHQLPMNIYRAVKITQSNEQSTILDLSFQTENQELGRNFLNALMKVYDSLNIEDKNRISISSLNFINQNLDTLEVQLDDLEGRVRNFRVSNEMFDVEDQSKMYLNNAEPGKRVLMPWM